MKVLPEMVVRFAKLYIDPPDTVTTLFVNTLFDITALFARLYIAAPYPALLFLNVESRTTNDPSYCLSIAAPASLDDTNPFENTIPLIVKLTL